VHVVGVEHGEEVLCVDLADALDAVVKHPCRTSLSFA
jgi:hypothetical protein